MPESLSARYIPSLHAGDFGLLLLRATAVVEDLNATIATIPPEHHQRTALVAAGDDLACCLRAVRDVMWRQITRPTPSDSAPTFGRFADSCGYNDGAQT